MSCATYSQSVILRVVIIMLHAVSTPLTVKSHHMWRDAWYKKEVERERGREPNNMQSKAEETCVFCGVCCVHTALWSLY